MYSWADDESTLMETASIALSEASILTADSDDSDQTIQELTTTAQTSTSYGFSSQMDRRPGVYKLYKGSSLAHLICVKPGHKKGSVCLVLSSEVAAVALTRPNGDIYSLYGTRERIIAHRKRGLNGKRFHFEYAGQHYTIAKVQPYQSGIIRLKRSLFGRFLSITKDDTATEIARFHNRIAYSMEHVPRYAFFDFKVHEQISKVLEMFIIMVALCWGDPPAMESSSRT